MALNAAHGAYARVPIPALPALGDYLDTAYIAALTRTGSPVLANQADASVGLPQVVSVQQDAAGRRVALAYGWKDGRLLLVIGQDGRMRREMAWGGPASPALRLARSGDLCLGAPGAAREHCYRRVGDAARFVARTVVAGAWKDRQGAPYWFTADGHAHFPGYDFSYALALDGRGWDGFKVEESGRTLAFRRAGPALTLFAVAPAAGVPDFGQPLAVLRIAAPGRPFSQKRTKNMWPDGAGSGGQAKRGRGERSDQQRRVG